MTSLEIEILTKIYSRPEARTFPSPNFVCFPKEISYQSPSYHTIINIGTCIMSSLNRPIWSVFPPFVFNYTTYRCKKILYSGNHKPKDAKNWGQIFWTGSYLKSAPTHASTIKRNFNASQQCIVRTTTVVVVVVVRTLHSKLKKVRTRTFSHTVNTPVNGI